MSPERLTLSGRAFRPVRQTWSLIVGAKRPILRGDRACGRVPRRSIRSIRSVRPHPRRSHDAHPAAEAVSRVLRGRPVGEVRHKRHGHSAERARLRSALWPRLRNLDRHSTCHPLVSRRPARGADRAIQGRLVRIAGAFPPGPPVREVQIALNRGSGQLGRRLRGDHRSPRRHHPSAEPVLQRVTTD
jgi:hypothetical protein